MSTILNYKSLKRITEGEMNYLTRRRASRTQVQQAEKMGMSRAQYRAEELSPTLVPHKTAALVLTKLTDGERCVLHRRRSDKTTLQVATDLKRCKYWIRQMENDIVAADELLKYWQD